MVKEAFFVHLSTKGKDCDSLHPLLYQHTERTREITDATIKEWGVKDKVFDEQGNVVCHWAEQSPVIEKKGDEIKVFGPEHLGLHAITFVNAYDKQEKIYDLELQTPKP